MSFARLIHDYIDDFAASDDGDAFEDFDDDVDRDDDIHDRHARRHRRSGRSGARRRGRRGRASRGRGHRRSGSTRDLVRLVVLTAIAISVIRRLRAGHRRSHRREYA